MTSLDEMRRELREKYEKLKGEAERTTSVPKLNPQRELHFKSERPRITLGDVQRNRDFINMCLRWKEEGREVYLHGGLVKRGWTTHDVDLYVTPYPGRIYDKRAISIRGVGYPVSLALVEPPGPKVSVFPVKQLTRRLKRNPDLERWEEYWKEKLTVFAFAWIRPWDRDTLLRVRLLIDEREIDWLEHIYPNWIVFVTTAEQGYKAIDVLREHSLQEVTIPPDPFT